MCVKVQSSLTYDPHVNPPNPDPIDPVDPDPVEPEEICTVTVVTETDTDGM